MSSEEEALRAETTSEKWKKREGWAFVLLGSWTSLSKKEGGKELSWGP